MPTARALPRVLLISDSYLLKGRLLDASRYSFTKTLAQVSEAVCFFHANSFPGDIFLQRLEETLCEFRPNAVIAFNSGCLRQLLLDYAAKEQISIVTWFWDSPVLFGYEQNRLARQTIVFHSDVSYRTHEGIDNVGEWMPFSSIPAEAYERKPTKDICFQGTLWAMTRVLQDMALGLTCQADGKYYYGAALYEALTERLDRSSEWRSPTTGDIYSYGLLLNALSALKRAKTLSWFAQKDLNIYGGDEWLSYLWPVAPELLDKCHFRAVQTHKDMRILFGDHRLSLNIFHLQNKYGGPNLRILDSATHFVPILSDYNQYCHELYPHGEAAFYFKSCDEGMEGLERILHEPGFGEKLAGQAARILNAGHTHNHRVRTMFSQAELVYEQQAKDCPVRVVSSTLPEDLFLQSEPSTCMPALQSTDNFIPAFPQHNKFNLQDRDRLIEASDIAKYEVYYLGLANRLSALDQRAKTLEAKFSEQTAIIDGYRRSEPIDGTNPPPKNDHTVPMGC